MRKLFVLAITVLGLFAASNVNATTIRVHATFGSPTDTAFVLKVVNSVKATGKLPLDVPNLQYVTPEHLMTSRGAILWIVDVTASAEETVSLADANVVISGTDSGDTFGKMVTFEGAAYAPTAPGVGPETISGPATQQVQRFIVGVWGKTATNPEQVVRTWFFGFENWAMTAQVTTGGTTATLTLRKLPPPLTMRISGGNLVVAAVNNGDTNRDYRVFSASSVTGPWASAGVSLRAGGGWTSSPPSGPMRFYRLVTP